MPGLLDKFCSILKTIKVGHLLDDLPFALWLGMIPTVRVESMGSGGCGPSPCDSVGVSAAGAGIPAGRMGSPSLTRRLR